MAAGYQPALREAPLVIGHPALDAPAWGWVGGLQVEPGPTGARLLATAKDVDSRFADMVRSRRFPKRSAAFYPPGHPSNPTPHAWYLRHIGFLGAQPPALTGLSEIKFVDGGAPSIHFEFCNQRTQKMEDTKTADDALRVQFAQSERQRQAAEAEVESLRQQIEAAAAARRAQAHEANVAFADAELAAGRLPPGERAAAIAVLDVLTEAAPVEFAEGDAQKRVSPVAFVRGLISTRPAAVLFGEYPAGARGGGVGGARPASDAQFDVAARRLAATQNITYAEALDRIARFGA
jgi:hypothetical protein